MIKIKFEIYLSSLNKYASEAELNEQLDQLQQELVSLPYWDGKITITETENDPQITIQDELGPIIQNLCFKGLEHFLTVGRAEILLFSEEGKLIMSGSDDAFIYFIMDDENYKFEQQSFLIQLFQCGSRFIDLLEKMPGSYGKTNASRLNGYREKCREMLKIKYPDVNI